MPKNECNLCQPIVDVLEQSYSTASEGFRQLKVDGWMNWQHDENCIVRDEKICLPLLRLLSKATGDAEKGLE